MAYKLMKEAGIYAASGYEYVCDAQSDISSLPTNSFGARALVVEDGSVWVLNSGGTWVKQAGSGGGGGGGGSSVAVTPLSVTSNGTYTAPSGSAYSPITVNVAGSAARMIAGGVNFIDDYDNTIVYSYTVDEFMEMSEMPPNPVHEGLTSQGWNWTLSDAKAQLTAMPEAGLFIGQMYITDDGVTRLYCHFDKASKATWFGIGLQPECTVVLDWGDGSDTQTIENTSGQDESIATGHTYSSPGDYVIRIQVLGDGWASIPGNSDTENSRLFGDGDGEHFPQYLSCLQRVETGSNIWFEDYAFAGCWNLSSVTMPNDPEMFMLDSMCTFARSGIRSLTLPNDGGPYAEDMFDQTHRLNYISLPMIWYGGYFPNSAFADSAIQCISIPDGYVEAIGADAFSGSKLSSISIPSSVKDLDNYVFSGCPNLFEIHFHSTTPPRTSTSHTFDGLPRFCVLYVPTGSLQAYTTAANFPDSNVYTYIEE